jgi:hypothetical protein
MGGFRPIPRSGIIGTPVAMIHDLGKSRDPMTIQQLRAAHKAIPFQPFTVHMADGRSFRVPHPDFLFMSPTVRTVIICQEDDEFSILYLLLMTEIEMTQAKSSKA